MFNMKLRTTIPLETIKPSTYDVKEYDDRLDDGRSVIADICGILEDTGKIQFVVSGFGDEQWPVDCRSDLSVIIEQLPELISKMNNDDFNFALDFYEQGIEREINLKDNRDNSVSLECISRTSWTPEPNRMVMKKSEINKILNMLYKDFLSYSTILCYKLANHYLFKEWMRV